MAFSGLFVNCSEKTPRRLQDINTFLIDNLRTLSQASLIELATDNPVMISLIAQNFRLFSFQGEHAEAFNNLCHEYNIPLFTQRYSPQR